MARVRSTQVKYMECRKVLIGILFKPFTHWLKQEYVFLFR